MNENASTGRSVAYLAIILTAIVGTAASLAAGYAVKNVNDRIADLAFSRKASESLQMIQAEVASANDALYTLRDLFDSADHAVSREEFQAFAQRLRGRFEGLRDTGWAPRVQKTARVSFEAQARTAGLHDYVIKQRNRDGKLDIAADRDVYFPIFYPDPVEMTAKVLGVDLTFEPTRRRAVLHSIETRTPASTPPLQLISGTGGINGFMSFLPVFGPDPSATTPRGIVYGVFEIAPMIERILKQTLHTKDMSLYFYDARMTPSEKPIYWHAADTGDPQEAVPMRADLLMRPHWEGELRLADQTWNVIFISQERSWDGMRQGLIWFGVGVVITGMIEIYLAISMRRTAQLQELTGQLRLTAKHLEERGEVLAHMATHDPLTGLPNRAALASDGLSIEPGADGNGDIAVLMLDLDRFKAVNDTLGHAAGDALLCQVAGRLRQTLRHTDFVARLGGDEFAVVQNGDTQPQDAEELAQRLVDALCRPYRISGQFVEIGVSIGIALSEERAVDLDLLLRRADVALYGAKSNGRGTWRSYGMDAQAHGNAA